MHPSLIGADRLPESRDLTCARCEALVNVVEIPGPRLDPAGFVCGECLAGTVDDAEPTVLIGVPATSSFQIPVGARA